MEKKTIKRKTKSSISEKIEFEILKLSARRSSSVAVRESRVLGLTIKFISNNNLIEELPNGEKNIIRKIKNISSKNGLKKGTVLCRK